MLPLLSNGNPTDSTSTDTLAFDAQGLIDSLQHSYIDSVEASLRYQHGAIEVGGVATLNVPDGFKFLDAEQSKHVIVDYWGNPPQVAEDVLGMLLPADAGALDNEAYSFVITYDPMGYVKDEDADDMDFDQVMKDMKESDAEENKARREAGFGGLELLGWASPPYYDKDRKVLHWALELQADDAEGTTLNYNVRVLGRKGVLIMNAVAGTEQLEMVKQNIPAVLAMATFNDGFKYEQFDSNVDEVAAVTIGGLVAGKVLAKAGLFAIILKFLVKLKFLWIAIVAGGAALWSRLRGKKNEPMPPAAPPQA